MPSQVVLEKKQQQVAELTARIKDSVAGVVVDYKGINVADDTALRKELREAGVEYTVVKNTLLKRAVDELGLVGLDSVFAGTTALATSKDDHIASARIIQKYADKHENFNIKSGYLDGEVIELAKVIALAKLPTREVLLATVCNVFNAPITAFARAVQAIVDKDGSETPEEATEEAPAETAEVAETAEETAEASTEDVAAPEAE